MLINVKAWDEVTIHIQARGSCVKRMTIIRRKLTKEMNSSLHITKIGKFPFQKLFIARSVFLALFKSCCFLAFCRNSVFGIGRKKVVPNMERFG